MKNLAAQLARTLAAYVALAAAGFCLWLACRKAEFSGPADLAAPKSLVVIDAGHGGHDGGAVANQFIEKTLSLDLARRLRSQLEAAGLAIRMTRESDAFLPLEKRAQIANDSGAAAFVSLHLNTTDDGDAEVRGMETYFCARKSLSAIRLIRERAGITDSAGVRDDRGRLLAEAIQRAACQRTGAENRGAKERSYTVIHTTACPAVLVECGFITNDAEAAKLKQEAYRDRLMAGVAEAVAAFLRVQEMQPARGLAIGPANSPEKADDGLLAEK